LAGFQVIMYGRFWVFTEDSHTGDSSDVVVRTPHVEIPWPHVACLNDEEMELVVWDAVPSAGVSTARA
jgi:hypothetical protein